MDTKKTTLESILTSLPSLRKLLGEYGEMSVFEYGKKHYRGLASDDPIFLERKSGLLHFLDSYVTERFGADMSQKVCSSLEKNYCVSTADHHGPMGHPFFFQSAVLRGLVNPDEAIINFCTSHVSLGNSSYPRGIVFHGDGENAPREYLKLPFFPAHQRMDAVFHLPAYTRENITTCFLAKLATHRKEKIVSEIMYDRIISFAESYVLTKDILEFQTYSEQLTFLNDRWWKSLFPTLPDFIPLDAEDIICGLLLKHLDSDTIITRMMTDATLQPFIEKYFDAISCCFDLVDNSGTYLFWHLDEARDRHALWREGDELVSKDKKFRMKMNTEEISFHIRSSHLIPSGLLTYAALTCYYGLTCFGGIFQDTYLTLINKAYKDTFNEKAFSTQTNIINADLYFLFIWKNLPLTALDFTVNNLEWAPLLPSHKISLKKAIEYCCVDL